MPYTKIAPLPLGALLSMKDRDNYRYAMRELGYSEHAYIQFLGRYEATLQDLEERLRQCQEFISNNMNEAGNVLARTLKPE